MIKLKYISWLITWITLILIPILAFKSVGLMLLDIIISVISVTIYRFTKFIIRNKVEDECYREAKM